MEEDEEGMIRENKGFRCELDRKQAHGGVGARVSEQEPVRGEVRLLLAPMMLLCVHRISRESVKGQDGGSCLRSVHRVHR